jgi:hypothetical protein
MSGARSFADGEFTDTACSVVDYTSRVVLDPHASVDDAGSPISCAGYLTPGSVVVSAVPGVSYLLNQASLQNGTGLTFILVTDTVEYTQDQAVLAGLSSASQDLTGPQGIQGIQGVQGIQGEQGVQGAAGDPGSDGAQGSQGEPGIQGTPGSSLDPFAQVDLPSAPYPPAGTLYFNTTTGALAVSTGTGYNDAMGTPP